MLRIHVHGAKNAERDSRGSIYPARHRIEHVAQEPRERPILYLRQACHAVEVQRRASVAHLREHLGQPGHVLYLARLDPVHCHRHAHAVAAVGVDQRVGDATRPHRPARPVVRGCKGAVMPRVATLIPSAGGSQPRVVPRHRRQADAPSAQGIILDQGRSVQRCPKSQVWQRAPLVPVTAPAPD